MKQHMNDMVKRLLQSDMYILYYNSLLKILLQFRTLDYQIRTPYTVMSSPLLSQNPAIPGNAFLKKLTSRQAVEMVLLLTANTQKYVSHSFR